MCGIAGFVSFKKGDVQWNHCLLRMTAALTHRGPDDEGEWFDADNGVALGHRRLSIIDLSNQGHQPMHSACGRYVVVFNGEIYNFHDIRKELEDSGATPVWRGHSDTEIVLSAIACWGLETAVKRFVGMFAFALWDRRERTLYLVRDRLGEKPIYYGWMGNTFLFASELKALRAHPEWRGEIDRNVLSLFLRYSYVPAPYSIYKSIYKLLPGTIAKLEVGRGDPTIGQVPAPEPYWHARQTVENRVATSFDNNDAEAIESMDSLLRDAVAHQMISDVPLGAFLSGGVDSSTIVALMQAQSSRPVKTFTIGFKEEGYNEAEYAKNIARHLGTDHTELYVTSADALNVIPSLPYIYDEPFADSSQIPTFLISQLARRYVKVSLSGDGGDELFGGYNRYLGLKNIRHATEWMPDGVRDFIARLIKGVSPQSWDMLFNKISPILPNKIKQRTPGDKLHKLAKILHYKNPMDIYFSLISQWEDPTYIVNDSLEPELLLTDKSQWPLFKDSIQLMMYLDMITYLPDDIMVKVDRASMGVGLESRAPFLDHRVVEFSCQIPMDMKIRNGQGKWLLRQVLYKYVPIKLIERPKSGFAVPIDTWLRGPLKEWAEDLLNEKRLIDEGFLNPEPIYKKWTEHLSGRCNWQHKLWNILMFQAWLEKTK
ncbi:MAG: asparagine synthase (glutamine-hydrolyzing) [Nitrospirae bacterium RIFOXYB2_FULL_43_5]|nr:MAG: asparagine synthase (glutamine-hydrolyzing) [Nitrospirae bacterium GWF2_44_13]OGW63525.1 MAG: asparagine synthase (glutamine-hydrolyzing) [Nitrospirae bacterium RIFOXYA2_FULL_44_9]OGW73116.1 MAG: asparagine synthase (glutamine-hydrolyzing) [Nitrospirae bacterium RIFOXYC2_FULL_44_7]OGW79028.1 MAG: asparagine synthase (glutamine-hydrolyzing) [Nitrospirae bacterium RIFOXYB2_FULL_43_5]